MIPTTLEEARAAEILLGQYTEARRLFGEGSSEAEERLRRLQSLTVTAE